VTAVRAGLPDPPHKPIAKLRLDVEPGFTFRIVPLCLNRGTENPTRAQAILLDEAWNHRARPALPSLGQIGRIAFSSRLFSLDETI
jgi:hypothetical protein